jgi:predicted RNA binding protein YcfA (HicA-like mRNA interferase family)
MGRKEELLARIRNNPQSVRFGDLTKLLTWYGFEYKRSKGSHHIYQQGHYNVIVPRRAPHLHSYVVRQVLKILDEILEQEE